MLAARLSPPTGRRLTKVRSALAPRRYIVPGARQRIFVSEEPGRPLTKLLVESMHSISQTHTLLTTRGDDVCPVAEVVVVGSRQLYRFLRGPVACLFVIGCYGQETHRGGGAAGLLYPFLL